MPKVLLFGAAADAAGAREVEVDASMTTTVEGLFSMLAKRHPALEPMRDSLAFAVNGEYAGREDEVVEGDEVAVLPPVSGG